MPTPRPRAAPLVPLIIRNRQDYFHELIEHITNCPDSAEVTLITMAFDPTVAQIRPLVAALNQAARRGVRVRLAVDAHAFLIQDEAVRWARPGPLLFRSSLPQRLPAHFQAKREALRELAANGATWCVTNYPSGWRRSPLHGRSHIKLALVGDACYLGGCNLSMDEADFMIRLHDPAGRRWLANLADRIFAQGRTSRALDETDQTFQLDARSQLLADAGRPGQSVIMQRALELIDQARERILLTTQYMPGGTLLARLTAARRRGVHIVIHYNHPATQAYPIRPAHYALRWLARRSAFRAFEHYEVPAGALYLHAKILASEQATLVGSHNYAPAGVRFGTAELALWRRDAAFAAELTAAFRQSYIPAARRA